MGYQNGQELPNSADSGMDDSYELLLVKYKLLFDYARDIILFVSQDGKILDANRAAVDMYGYTKEELLRMHVFDLRKYDKKQLVLSQLEQANNASIIFETIHKTKNGDPLPVEVSSTGVTFNGQRILMSIIRDISAKKEYLSRIEKLAYYDELTTIPNRKSFRDHLRSRVSDSKKKFALLLIDIDNFKKVNDTCTHSIGDGFLAAIAGQMTKAVGTRGTLYRLGGDEFTVLTKSAESRPQILEIVEDIRTSVNQPFEIDGYRINTSLSIGISIFPDDGESEAVILKHADLAMYRVKENNKDGFAFFA